MGLTAMVLLFIQGTASLGRLGIKARAVQDRYLVFSLLGIVLGMAVCLGTVWLSAHAFFRDFGVVPINLACHGRRAAIWN